MKAGEEFTRDNVPSIRLGHGPPVKDLPRILGCKSAAPIERGMPLEDAQVQ